MKKLLTVLSILLFSGCTFHLYEVMDGNPKQVRSYRTYTPVTTYYSPARFNYLRYNTDYNSFRHYYNYPRYLGPVVREAPRQPVIRYKENVNRRAVPRREITNTRPRPERPNIRNNRPPIRRDTIR